ncbi:MAG: TolB family protein [Pseudonocardiaceae bacterium]
MRKLIVLGLLAGLAGLAALTALPAGGKAPSPNGRIAFARFDAALDGLVTYTANPDGSHVQRLFSGGHSQAPRWSPDGNQVAVLAACADGEENCAFTIVDPDTGASRQVKMLDPTLFTACIVWSPDSKRLACEGFGEPDPNRNGIYTVRSSDGGGLTRMTSNSGGEDLPGDYSPQGTRLVFARFDQNGDPAGLYVVKTDGSQLRPITPPGTIVSSPGDWSPQGNAILFARRVSEDMRNSLWVVHADGSGLREIRVHGEPACGGPIADATSRGCIHPRWSPDGKKIIFGIATATTDGGTENDGETENIYTVNADGTGLTQVTHGVEDEAPDWGTHTLIR